MKPSLYLEICSDSKAECQVTLTQSMHARQSTVRLCASMCELGSQPQKQVPMRGPLACIQISPVQATRQGQVSAFGKGFCCPYSKDGRCCDKYRPTLTLTCGDEFRRKSPPHIHDFVDGQRPRYPRRYPPPSNARRRHQNEFLKLEGHALSRG